MCEHGRQAAVVAADRCKRLWSSGPDGRSPAADSRPFWRTPLSVGTRPRARTWPGAPGTRCCSPGRTAGGLSSRRGARARPWMSPCFP